MLEKSAQIQYGIHVGYAIYIRREQVFSAGVLAYTSLKSYRGVRWREAIFLHWRILA